MNLVNFLCFSLLLVSQNGRAQDYEFDKLTDSKIVHIKIHPTADAALEDPAKSILAVQVQRQAVAIKKSAWKSLASKQNLKIAVVGDSGCRLKEGPSGSEYQSCQDPKAWPFAEIIQQIIKEKPDLILHLGDYHYREQCSKNKDCKKISSSVGYSWLPWAEDFFKPARPSFKLAPWILVRGNHEDCHRAFLGYSNFLASQDPKNQTCVDYEPADFIELKDLLIVNLDSSSISENLETDSSIADVWTQRFKQVAEQVSKNKIKTVWLITHKPIYGLVKKNSKLVPANVNLQKYLEASPLKNQVKIIFSGHIHLSEILKPVDGPLQVILGNGGTQLDHFQDLMNKTDPKALGFQSLHVGSAGFGYAILTRAKNKKPWNLNFKNQSGETTYQCDLARDWKSCP